jgi:hypothetical protein
MSEPEEKPAAELARAFEAEVARIEGEKRDLALRLMHAEESARERRKLLLAPRGLPTWQFAVAVAFALAFLVYEWVQPPPRITVAPAAVTVTHEAPPPDFGYVISDDEGLPHFVPWPSEDVVQRYDEETFRADCDAVCSSPYMGSRLEERQHGRVLFCQPERLLCVCFREGSSWPITRYVAWDRVGN